MSIIKTTRQKYQNSLRSTSTTTQERSNEPDQTLDINGIQRNSIPTSDRIPGACVKRTLPQVKMPAGKTIGIAYNKGNYQVVDAADIKTMGKKI